MQDAKMIISKIIVQYNLASGGVNMTPKLYGYFYNNENIYLILKCAPGGTLFECLENMGKLLEKTIARIACHLCRTVDGLMHHNHNIHQDIKPENLLLGARSKQRILAG